MEVEFNLYSVFFYINGLLFLVNIIWPLAYILATVYMHFIFQIKLSAGLINVYFF